MRYEESHHPAIIIFIAPLGTCNLTGAVKRHGPTNRHGSRLNHLLSLHEDEGRALCGAACGGGQSAFLSLLLTVSGDAIDQRRMWST